MSGEIKIYLEISASPALAVLIQALAEALRVPDRGATEQEPAEAAPAAPPVPPPPLMTERADAGARTPVVRCVPGVPKWTPDRIVQMALMRADGAKWPEILAAVNAMPGAEILTARAVEVAFFTMKREGRLPKVVCPPPPARQALPAANGDDLALPAAGESPQVAPPDMRLWTPERVTMLKRNFPTPRGLDAILILLNALPGAPIKTVLEMKTKAEALGLKRPDFNAQIAAPVVASQATVRAWAAERGMCDGDAALNIAAVNAKRAQLGLAPFALEGRR